MVKSSRFVVIMVAVLSMSALILGFSGVGSKIVAAASGFGFVTSSDQVSSDPEAPMNTVQLSDFSTAYSETFDSLPSTGTGLNANLLPTGWTFSKSDSNTTFATSDGTVTAGNIYSFGAASATERSLGSLDTDSATGTFGVLVENKTGRTAKGFSISYTGEQWRRGAGTGDKLIFEYCTNCTSVSAGTWTAVTALDFTSPFQGTNSNQIDKEQNGNLANRQTTVTGTVTVNVNNNGDIRFRWRGTNITGNDDGLAIDNLTIRAIPTVPETSLTATPLSLTTSTTASFSFATDDAAATFECSLDGAAYAACTSPRSLTGLSQGSHTFDVRATSATGTDATPATYTWTVDNVAPTATLTSSPSGTRATTSETISFSATDATSGVAFYECSLNNVAFTTCTSPVSVSGLAQGAQSFRVRATDNAGNASSPQTASWTVDTIAPAISTFTPLANGPATGSRTISFNVTDAGTVQSVAIETSISSPALTEGGPEAPTVYTTSFTSSPCALTNAPNSTYTCTIPGAPAGSSVTYRVSAQDAAGNTRTVPSTGSFTYLVTSSSGQTALPPGTYDNLSLDSTITIGGDVTINNVLTLSGVVDAGNNTVTFGCGASVSINALSAFIDGAVQKQFCGVESFTYPIGVNEPGVNATDGTQGVVAPIYAPVTVTIQSVTSGSSLTIEAFSGQMTGAAPTHYVGVYWTTFETGDVTADLRFGWEASSEVGNSTFYQGLRRTGVMTESVVASFVDILNRHVDFFGVTDFQGAMLPLVEGTAGGPATPYEWTAALIGTTAGRNELSGKVLSSEGLPLKGVSVTLIGGDIAEPVTVRTNQFGVYSFAGLEAGSTYVVNVNSRRHTFSNNTKVVYLSDSLTDENFVADRR